MPEDPIVTHTLVDLYEQQGFRDKAAQVLEKIIELNPNDTSSITRLQNLKTRKTYPGIVAHQALMEVWDQKFSKRPEDRVGLKKVLLDFLQAIKLKITSQNPNEKKVLVINGPNLNLLGIREPQIYGDHSLEEIKNYTGKKLAGQKVHTDWFQSNRESEILDKIQHSNSYSGIVLNPGSMSHTSFALYDCLKGMSCKVVEVHLTNTHKRESFRSERLSARACLGVIEGLGKNVYYLGILSLLD